MATAFAPVPTAGCQTCIEMTKKPLQGKALAVSINDLLEEPAPHLSKKSRKRLKQGKEREFLRHLNALMNAGGGLLCLHVANVHLLGSFDQSVDSAMAGLISDGSTFSENFERHLKDDHHVVFRVKHKERSLSSVSFHTKISYDKGVEDATHGQVTHLLVRKEQENGQAATAVPADVTYTLEKDKEVKVAKGNTSTVVFQESINTQAKKVPELSNNLTAQQKRAKLTNFFFDEENKPGPFLPKYFSAFSKLPNGGSILLGVEEFKETVPKWKEVQKTDRDNVLSFKDPQMNLWSYTRDETPQYVFSERRPSEQIEKETGEFKCQGVVLNAQERACFKQDILQKAKDLMYWHPGLDEATDGSHSPTFTPPVDVRFHEVTGGPADLVVPEITVGNYKGMAFMGREGPEAYYIQTATEVVTRMTMDMWFEEFQNTLCENCRMPKHVDSCHCGD